MVLRRKNKIITNKQNRKVIDYNKLTRPLFVLGIIIILNLLFGYAIKVFYEEPQFDEYCQLKQVEQSIADQQTCLDVGGQWNENDNYLKPLYTDQRTSETLVDTSTGWCDKNYTCSQDYENAREDYEKNVFILLVSLGVIAMIVGVFSKIEILSVSLIGGGILSLIIASVRYWQYASDILHLVILSVALGFLIWIAVKKFKD